MPVEFKALGVDPLFPGGGESYISANGFYFDEDHGGKKVYDWLEKHFEAREDDIYVISYPKTGTTWVQELSYVIANDLNFEKARSKKLGQRCPYLEKLGNVEKGVISNLTSPRYFKCHFPFSLLPKSILEKNSKILYTIRNPKDTVVSFYHFSKVNPDMKYSGDFETFFDLFINDERLIYSPFSKHILEYWNQRNRENILIIHYEDLQTDCIREIHRIATFLGKTLTDTQAQQVAEYCCFNNMKSQDSTNYKYWIKDGDFMRKGQVGDWKNYFTEEMNKKMDDYVEKHFKNSSLEFKYLI